MTEKKKNEVAAVQSTIPNNFSADDFQIPRIELLQAMSPAVAEGQGIPGTLVNSITKDPLGTGKAVNIVVVRAEKNYIKWRPRTEGGGIEYRTKDSNDPRVIEDIKWRGMEKPSCTQYINFLCLIEGQQLPIILSCAMTNYVMGKNLMTMAFLSGNPSYNSIFELSAKTKSNKFGTFFVFNVKKVGPTSDEMIEMAKALHKMFEHTDLGGSEGTQEHTTSNYAGEEL